MTITTVPDELIVNGVDIKQLAYDMSWEVEYTLVPGQRPFGPEYVAVDVLEIHANETVWGFLAAHGLPGKNTYVAVSEVTGDENWHNVVSSVDGNDDDAMDAAGRAVIADKLIRGQVQTMESNGQI
jgi:hypothetical protein